MSRFKDITEIPVIGLQAFIKEYLIQHFNENFFWKDINVIRNADNSIISRGNQEISIYKDPKTDTGHFKKSHKGWVAVIPTENGINCVDNLSEEEKEAYSTYDMLIPIFRDSKMLFETSFAEIRNRF